MRCEYIDQLSINTCQLNPDAIFVFGDNLIRSGKAGQAVIRAEPNAFGIPTKRLPSLSEYAFFKDKECERNHVITAMRQLYVLSKNRKIFWPSKGIGTGLAKMPENSPLIYKEMCDILINHFGINNIR